MARTEASQTWAMELLELGYLEEMPAPSPLAQALLIQIKDREFHEFLVGHENAVQNDGESILANFDIAMWLEIFANRNPMDKLMLFRSQLTNILRKDYEQIKECLGTINRFILALLRANVKGIRNPTTSMSTMPVKSHPLLQGKELCEEATSIINAEPETQPDEITPESFKAHMYPIIPVRVVEDLAAINGNKMWTMWSLQLVASFSLDALITLTAINGAKSIDEFKAECYRDAINNGTSVRGEVLLKDISMQVFDAGRCSKPVKLHCKAKIPPLIKRTKDYYKLVWNYNRPFIKCTCQQGDQCPNNNILWFDHALWFLANNIESCWITSDKLEVQFISFVQWLLLDSTKEAIRALVVFMYTRELMIIAAEEYAEGKTRLLQSYGENEGPRYIEQLFLPQEFSRGLAKKRNAPRRRFSLNPNEAANEANSGINSAVPSHYTTRGRGRNRGGRGKQFTPQYSRSRGYTPNVYRGSSSQATPSSSVVMSRNSVGVMNINGMSVEGVSIGAQETCIILPSLNIAFDIGRWPRRAISQEFLFISHSHMDHIGGITMYVATRGLYRLKPPTVIVPSCIKATVEKLFEVHRELDGSELKHQLVGLDVGEEYDMGKKFIVKPFKTYHTIPSQGYIVYSVKQKLKLEYVGLPGNELKKLKLEGVEITNTIRTPEVAFTGDTTADFVLDELNKDALNAKLLISEATFVDDSVTVEHARSIGHLHLSEIVELADKFQNEAILLIHFSARYEKQVIIKAMDMLPLTLKDRVYALTHGFRPCVNTEIDT